eukprot:104701_1
MLGTKYFWTGIVLGYEFGQLGYEDTNDRGDGSGEMGYAIEEIVVEKWEMLCLLKVDLGTAFNVTDIVAGWSHTCAVSTLNKIKCGEMGNVLLEVDLGTGINVTDIVSGNQHTSE